MALKFKLEFIQRYTPPNQTRLFFNLDLVEAIETIFSFNNSKYRHGHINNSGQPSTKYTKVYALLLTPSQESIMVSHFLPEQHKNKYG